MPLPGPQWVNLDLYQLLCCINLNRSKGLFQARDKESWYCHYCWNLSPGCPLHTPRMFQSLPGSSFNHFPCLPTCTTGDWINRRYHKSRILGHLCWQSKTHSNGAPFTTPQRHVLQWNMSSTIVTGLGSNGNDTGFKQVVHIFYF